MTTRFFLSIQRTLWLPVVLAGALTALAAPDAPQAKSLSLPDCIQLALQNNLDLAIERYNPQLALYGLNGSYGGYDPGFNFSGQHDHGNSAASIFQGGLLIPGSENVDSQFSTGLNGLTPWGMTYGLTGNASYRYGNSFGVDTNGVITPKPYETSTTSAQLSLVQPLLKNFWIDSTRYNIQVAKNRLKYTELSLKQVIMDTATSIEQAYYDLISARQRVVVQEKAVELAQRLFEENSKRVEVGAMAPLDAKQAESQAASSEADLISARYLQSVQENKLKQIISANFSQWANISIQTVGKLEAPKQFFDLQDSWSKGLSLRPNMLQARLDLDRAGIQVKYNRNQLYPELDVFGSYGLNGSGGQYGPAFSDLGTGDRPFYSAGARISMPLGNTSARNNYRNSKAVQSQAVLSLKRLEQNIMIQIDNDIKAAQSSYQAVEATRKAREYAAEALAAGQKKLENGKSTTFEVLQLQRDLISAAGNEITALAAYNKSIAQLALDEGSTLERFKIDLTVR